MMTPTPSRPDRTETPRLMADGPDNALLRDILQKLATLDATLQKTREEMVTYRGDRDRATQAHDRIDRLQSEVAEIAINMAKGNIPQQVLRNSEAITELDKFKAQALVIVAVGSVVGSIVSSVIVFLITRSIGA